MPAQPFCNGFQSALSNDGRRRRSLALAFSNKATQPSSAKRRSAPYPLQVSACCASQADRQVHMQDVGTLVQKSNSTHVSIEFPSHPCQFTQWIRAVRMSALCHKQTFMPYSIYLVGELLHGQRNIQAERLRGLENSSTRCPTAVSNARNQLPYRCPGHVRFTPESGHQPAGLRCPLSANTGLMRRSKKGSLFDHIIGAGQHGGRKGARPNALAVRRCAYQR